MKTEVIVLNEERKVSLTCYVQPVGGEFTGISERPAVLVIPGGGYRYCSDREADPVALAYLKAGYHAFILRYSCGKHAVWPTPLNDYEQAMSLIREKAGEWHIASDRIVVIGFSAGGHLAACAATMSKNRPNAAILGYPDISGAFAWDLLKDPPDILAAVDSNTCPCFIFASRTDNLVPVKNSVGMIDALTRNDVAFESHIYSNAPHGLSTGDLSVGVQEMCRRYPNWVADSLTWLEDVLGGFGPEGLTAPNFGFKINGNRDETLNLDCTLEYLAGFPAVRALVPDCFEGPYRYPEAAGSVITLGSFLRFAKLSEEAVREIETKLKAIPKSDKEA